MLCSSPLEPRGCAFAWLLLVSIAGTSCKRNKPPPAPGAAYGLDCVLEANAASSECVRVATRQQLVQLELSDSKELVIERVRAKRIDTTLEVDVDLRGRFHNEADQNVYLFIGPAPASATPTTYALSADTTFAADVGYPVRNTITFGHTNDLRVGLMAPHVSAYTPQLYLGADVRAVSVGEDTGIGVRVEDHHVSVVVPLDRAYAHGAGTVPARLAVTVATARDYVGFVDQATAIDVGADETTASSRPVEAMTYPMLDFRAHRFERVVLRSLDEGRMAVDLDMAAPVTDWGQTNLQLFFVPVPPEKPREPLFDPSHSRPIPWVWSAYLAVYSPHRLFWKASRGEDFSFDGAYAERSHLEPAIGVKFVERAAGRYTVELSGDRMREARRSGAGVGLVVAAGRDGFGPTSWLGVTPKKP